MRKNWQRQTFYKCRYIYCHSDRKIIVAIGAKSQNRVYYCPDCSRWTVTRLDRTGMISSEQEYYWSQDPGDWMKKHVGYYVRDYRGHNE